MWKDFFFQGYNVNKKRFFYPLLLICSFILFYLGSRVYYAYTDGFTVSNIKSSTIFEKPWETRHPTPQEVSLMNELAKQKFTYLGKGCQSYVFLSQDGLYVLKFIKHQRFATKPWLNAVSFLPYFSSYQNERLLSKKQKLIQLLTGWQVAFNYLPEETGVKWLHLNEKTGPSYPITIVDKIGLSSRIDLMDYQYLIQNKVEMLDTYLLRLFERNEIEEANSMMDKLLQMILDIYKKGFADTDHALMQNTGVANNMPLPVDIGQIAKDEEAKKTEVYNHALFNKTYRLRQWLEEHSPETKNYLEYRLNELIGPELLTMQPHKDV